MCWASASRRHLNIPRIEYDSSKRIDQALRQARLSFVCMCLKWPLYGVFTGSRHCFRGYCCYILEAESKPCGSSTALRTSKLHQRFMPSVSDLHLCHCADTSVEPHLPSLFWSIARHTTPPPPTIHFICFGSDSGFPERVATEAARHGLPCVTYWLGELSASRFPHLRTYDVGCQGNAAAFYGRWLLAELLPSSLDRVIYLDTDLIVQDDLRQLVAHLPEGVAVAAAPDMPFASCKLSTYFLFYRPHLRALGLSTRRGEIFNTGVLVLSLETWRREAIADQLIHGRDDMLAKGLCLRLQDQDVMNVVLVNSTHILSPLWNVTPLYLPASFLSDPGLDSAKILHFVTSPKPWIGDAWTTLPGQAVEIYLRTKAAAAPDPEESQRWLQALAMYHDVTEDGAKILTPRRKRRLLKILEVNKEPVCAKDSNA